MSPSRSHSGPALDGTYQYIAERSALEDAGGSIGRNELLEQPALPERTPDDALSRLEEDDVIRRSRDGSDLRFVRIELAD